MLPYKGPLAVAGWCNSQMLNEDQNSEIWSGPLQGVRVLDFTRVLAGPFATQTLAHLGADVVKIESPDGGDDTRNFPPLRDGVSHYFLSVNRWSATRKLVHAGSRPESSGPDWRVSRRDGVVAEFAGDS